MEFPFNCEKILGVDADGFAILDGKKGMNSVASTNRAITRTMPDLQNNMYDLIDKMGAASAKAQALPAIITTASRLFTSDNRLYLRAEGNKVIGLLKVGVKKLFIRNEMGAIKEISPLCVLDFYVHESVQRGGQGKALFEKMLEAESVKPEKLGYDRPSEKLLGFLAKHYGLKRYVPQNNNYVVYNAYFESANDSNNLSRKQQQEQNSQQFGFGQNSNSQRRTPGSQSLQMPNYSQTMYNPNQSQSGNALPQANQITNSNIFGTQNNFYMQQQQQQSRQQLPPKPVQKQPDQSSLTNAGGQQVFGAPKNSMGSSQSNKRSSTTDRVFGGVMNQEECQKENNYLKQDTQQFAAKTNQLLAQQQMQSQGSQRRQGQRDTMGSLLQDMQSMTINETKQSHIKNGQDYQLSKLNSKLSDNESIIKKNQEEMQMLMMKTNQNQMQQNNGSKPGQLQRPPSSKNVSILAPYVQIPGGDASLNSDIQKPPSRGPTSFTAAGGDYIKRTQYATLNDDSTQRLNDNQQFVQLQKQINNGARIPWASYNYQFQHYRK